MHRDVPDPRTRGGRFDTLRELAARLPVVARNEQKTARREAPQAVRSQRLEALPRAPEAPPGRRSGGRIEHDAVELRVGCQFAEEAAHVALQRPMPFEREARALQVLLEPCQVRP